MILDEKNIEDFGKTYTQCPIRVKVWLQCDYCGVHFQRTKKSRQRLNVNIDKDSCGSNPCTLKKKEEVYLNNHGCKNPFQSDEVKAKIKETNKARYGEDAYFSSDDFKNKRHESLLDKYGVESPLQSKEINSKQRSTCLEKYGVENFSQHSAFAQKVKNNCLEKYGVESPTQLPEIIEKRKKTTQEKYGVEHYRQTKEYSDRLKKISLEKYGTEHPWASPKVREKIKSTCVEKYGTPYYSQTPESKENYKNRCLELYGVPNPLMLRNVESKAEKELKDWLNSFGFDFKKNRSILDGVEIDLFDERLGLGVEYCGLYWHNELSNNGVRDKKYHYDKYIGCRNKGVKLITLFEDEWLKRKKQCKSFLQSLICKNDRVPARKCSVKEIDKNTIKDFCDLWHIQASSRLSIVGYGIFLNSELLGIVSLGRHPRYSDKVVLDRLCFKSGVTVVGGASKLFKRCRDWASLNQISKLVTWSDNRWSNGNVYTSIGFIKDKDILPDYSYVDLKHPGTRYSKQSQKKDNVDCPVDLTEHEWALERGLAKIWDCGKIRWIYKQ